MSTLVEVVEKWYAAHQNSLTAGSQKLRIRSYKPLDMRLGKVEIGIETHRMLASISLWNKGDIAVLTVDKLNGTEHTAADRTLAPDEDIPSLLRRHFSEVLTLRDPQSGSE